MSDVLIQILTDNFLEEGLEPIEGQFFLLLTLTGRSGQGGGGGVRQWTLMREIFGQKQTDPCS